MKKLLLTLFAHLFDKFLLYIGVFCMATPSWGQGLYNQSNLYINEVNMYVEGEIINTGSLINDGLIAITQDWNNQGIYRGKGTLEAYGNEYQRILHNEKVQNFVVKGWGTKIIKGQLSITDELHLLQGIVRLAEGDELCLKEKAIIYGGSAESHVEGAITVEGTGYKFFPLGKNGIYAPIEYLNVKGPTAKFSVEVFENAPIITVENTIVKQGIYWQRKDLVGNFGGSAVAIEFDPSHFADINKMIMVAGSEWNKPFMAIENVDHSQEKNQLSTQTDVMVPIIMLGEISETWAEADFYFSTALSPNAANIDNRKAKVFGERLAEEYFRFEVFNRWGAIVYETTSLESMQTTGWDGRGLNGDYLVTGPYPYRLIGYDKTGKRLEKKGVISIVY